MRTEVISVALDERDPLTSQHCSRVAALSLDLGRRCGLSQRECRALRTAAVFHDVGKIGIPDHVLLKVTPFTAADWAVMKTHSARSQRLILAAGIEDGEMVGLVARHHHERFDGTGYPDGLAGTAIPLMARIISLADTYDAMAQTRIYRQAWPHDRIMDVLHEERGRQHDPDVFTEFAELIERSPFKARAVASDGREAHRRHGDGSISGH